MFKIVMYTTEEEAQRIISTETANGLLLVEVQNIVNGNFLGFVVVKPAKVIVDTSPEQLAALQETQLIIMDALATIYENQLLLGGGIVG